MSYKEIDSDHDGSRPWRIHYRSQSSTRGSGGDRIKKEGTSELSSGISHLDFIFEYCLPSNTITSLALICFHYGLRCTRKNAISSSQSFLNRFMILKYNS